MARSRTVRRRAWLAVLLLGLAAAACTGVPNPDTAPDNYLREVGFEVALKQTVLLRWRIDAMPLRVHLPPPAAGLFQGREAQIHELVRSCLIAWSDVVAPGVPAFEFVDDSAGADFPIVWLSRPPVGEMGSDWNIAETLYDIVANAKRFGVGGILVTGRWNGGEIATDPEIRARVLHEVGHALGLRHSPRPEDVMYVRPSAQQLSSRDETTLRLLYESPNGRRMVPSHDSGR